MDVDTGCKTRRLARAPCGLLYAEPHWERQEWTPKDWLLLAALALAALPYLVEVVALIGGF